MIEPQPAETFTTGLAVCYEVKLYLATLMSKLAEGDVLEFLSTDPQAEHAITDWAILRGYEIIDVQHLDEKQTRFLMRR